MSDARMVELERRFRTTGTVEDEAAWLKARQRVGELGDERLRLAAWCGREAALAVVGRGAAEAPSMPQPWESPGRVALQWWVMGLGGFGPGAPVRAAALVFAERVGSEGRWLRRRLAPSAGAAVDRVEAALVGLGAAVETWTGCPCAEHAAAVARAQPDLSMLGSGAAGIRDEAEATELDHFAVSGAALVRLLGASPEPFTLEVMHAEVRRSIEQLGYNPSREALGAAELDPPPGATRQSRLAAGYVCAWLRQACNDLTALSADTLASEGEMARRLRAELGEALGRWALEG